MLGHCLPPSEEMMKQGRRWNMGTVLLFNGTTEIPVHNNIHTLRTLGCPQCCSLLAH